MLVRSGRIGHLRAIDVAESASSSTVRVGRNLGSGGSPQRAPPYALCRRSSSALGRDWWCKGLLIRQTQFDRHVVDADQDLARTVAPEEAREIILANGPHVERVA